jgi:hypothetical protein
MGTHFFIIQHIVKIDGIVSFNEKLRWRQQFVITIPSERFKKSKFGRIANDTTNPLILLSKPISASIYGFWSAKSRSDLSILSLREKSVVRI